MGYSSNKRFSPLTDSIGVVIDGCGDTYENKYYVNGMYIDLCGMSIEDYMSNPCCGNCNGDSDVVTKPVNKITVKSFENEAGEIYYQAYATFAVTSNMKISVTSTTGVLTELEIYAGQMKSEPERGETLELMSFNLNITEDDNYTYVANNGTIVTSDIYVATLHVRELSELDATDILKFAMTSMEPNTTLDLKFIIPATDVNYNLFDDIDEFERFCIDNQYCFAVVLPKTIYDKKQYVINNYGGSDVTKNFVQEGSVFTVNDKEVVCLVEKAKDDIMPFVPLYNEELSYEYKLTLNN